MPEIKLPDDFPKPQTKTATAGTQPPAQTKTVPGVPSWAPVASSPAAAGTSGQSNDGSLSSDSPSDSPPEQYPDEGPGPTPPDAAAGQVATGTGIAATETGVKVDYTTPEAEKGGKPKTVYRVKMRDQFNTVPPFVVAAVDRLDAINGYKQHAGIVSTVNEFDCDELAKE
jgi:hypothetical protein